MEQALGKAQKPASLMTIPSASEASISYPKSHSKKYPMRKLHRIPGSKTETRGDLALGKMIYGGSKLPSHLKQQRKEGRKEDKI